MNVVTIRHTSKDKDIWLQYDNEGHRLIGAVHSENEPQAEGSWFKPLSILEQGGIFSESQDVLLGINEFGQVTTVESYLAATVEVKPIAVGTPAIEHRDKTYRCSIWGKGHKVRLYVKAPKGGDLGYYDLIGNEWIQTNEDYFSSDESKQEFVKKVTEAAKGVSL